MTNREFCLRQPFDLFQRYEAVARILEVICRRLRRRRLKVLDVGGLGRLSDGSPFLPARAFLPDHRVEVVDIADANLEGYCQVGKRESLGENRWDVVISCDTLEHVPAADRADFVLRLSRAAKHCMVLGAPFADPEVRLCEEIFHEYHLRTAGAAQPALQEHFAHGLPSLESVERWLEEAGLAYVSVPSIHLYAWLWMMIARHYLISLPDYAPLLSRVDLLYNSSFFEADQRNPSYRRILVIDKRGRRPLLEDVVRLFAAFASREPSLHQSPVTMRLLLDLVELQHSSRLSDRVDSAQLDRSETWGELAPGQAASFIFMATSNGLSKIDLLVATYGRQLSCGLRVRLQRQDQDRWTDVEEIRWPAGALRDVSWHSFPFPPILDSAGHFFKVAIDSPAARPGSAPTVYCDANRTPTYRAFVQPVDSDSARLATDARRSELAEERAERARRLAKQLQSQQAVNRELATDRDRLRSRLDAVAGEAARVEALGGDLKGSLAEIVTTLQRLESAQQASLARENQDERLRELAVQVEGLRAELAQLSDLRQSELETLLWALAE